MYWDLKEGSKTWQMPFLNVLPSLTYGGACFLKYSRPYMFPRLSMVVGINYPQWQKEVRSKRNLESCKMWFMLDVICYINEEHHVLKVFLDDGIVYFGSELL